jgi:hypothetical protein
MHPIRPQPISLDPFTTMGHAHVKLFGIGPNRNKNEFNSKSVEEKGLVTSAAHGSRGFHDKHFYISITAPLKLSIAHA